MCPGATSSTTRAGLAPSLSFGLGSADIGHVQLSAREPERRAGLRTAVGPARTRRSRTAPTRPAGDRLSNFYGLRRSTSRRHTTIWPRSVSTTTSVRGALRNSTRYGQTRRDSAITAPRRQQHEHRHPAHAIRVARQTALAAPTRPTSRRGSRPGTRGLRTSGLEFGRETREPDRETGRRSPAQSLPSEPRRRSGPMPVIGPATGAARTATTGAYLFDTVSLASGGS